MGKKLVYGIAVAIVLMVATIVRLYDPAPVARMRLVAFDTYQQVSPRKVDPAYPVRIIDIDEASLEKYGPWPWHRDILAELVNALHTLEAHVVAFDFVFPNAGVELFNQIPRALREDQELQPLIRRLEAQRSGDTSFAQAMREKRVVLGLVGRTGEADPEMRSKAAFAKLGGDPARFIPSFPAATGNLAMLREAAAGSGALNWFPEYDQIVRKVPMVIGANGKLFPSLTSETLRVALDTSTIAIRTSTASGEQSFGGETGITSVRLGDVTIPTDQNGQIWMSFTRTDPGRYRSAADILDGNVPKEDIQHRLVLIGTSSAGLLDLRATPLDSVIAGVEVHAMALEQMIAGAHLNRPDFSQGMEIAFFWVAGLLMAVLVYRSGAFVGAGLGGILVGAVLAGAWFAYSDYSLLLDPTYPIAVLTVIYLFGTGYFYFWTEKERNQVRHAFSHYMAPSLVERLTRDPQRLQLGGETRDLSVMFSDVRGFTKIAEGYRDNPRGLTQLMNRLLSPLTKAIMERNGTIDKYMGDAVMAFWNAPLDDPDHRTNAAQAALDMQAGVDALNVSRKEEAGNLGRSSEPLKLGVAVATGPGMVGNMGSDVRFDYSVMGDIVNLSARLEGLTKHYGIGILIDDETRKGLNDISVMEIDLVRVKGRDAPERIWGVFPSVAARTPDWRSFRERFDEFLAAYRGANWSEAEATLDALTDPAEPLGFSDLISVYAERLEHFRTSPPLDDWDGSWTMEHK
ncbi:MAG: adenylate/guanylate cyclase domain-containing protein [Pseudomonadota bacterium]